MTLATSEPPGMGPTGARPPAHLADVDAAYATQEIGSGVAAMRTALGAHVRTPSLAYQLAGAMADLMRPLDLAAPAIMATSLARTDLFSQWVERMAKDAASCVEAYNGAINPTMRPLNPGELPLWHIASGVRRPVMACERTDIPADELAPRAMMMTGLMRMAGCDVFVHGVGAGGADARGGYERATDDWLKRWLEAAPSGRVVVASATLRLALPGETPTDEEVAAAGARAHKARHDPRLLGDEETAARKERLLGEIAGAKEAGDDPAPLFAAMQALVREYRDRHADALARLDEEASALRERQGEAAIRGARDWAWPMYSDAQIRALKDRIDDAFA